ncbi:MAG: hypothetical protein CM15mP107_0380 [Bacteroidota bacterium]|nr:MAG: hypothetical protein CM15mP107_0380 [Bacteroidota bacterium]
MINCLRIVVETLVQSIIFYSLYRKMIISLHHEDMLQQNYLTEPFQAPGNCDILLKLYSSSFLILAQSITNI